MVTFEDPVLRNSACWVSDADAGADADQDHDQDHDHDRDPDYGHDHRHDQDQDQDQDLEPDPDPGCLFQVENKRLLAMHEAGDVLRDESVMRPIARVIPGSYQGHLRVISGSN